jgi:hypothetical protein
VAEGVQTETDWFVFLALVRQLKDERVEKWTRRLNR